MPLRWQSAASFYSLRWSVSSCQEHENRDREKQDQAAGSRGAGGVPTGLTDIIDRASSCSIAAGRRRRYGLLREWLMADSSFLEHAPTHLQRSGEENVSRELCPGDLVAGQPPDQSPHFEDTDRGEHLRGGQAA